jgi:hypothetical protein
VVDTTRGRNRVLNTSSASRLAVRKPGAFGNGGSRLTSTRRVPGEGASAASAPSLRRQARSPSVQKISPENGSADAAAVMPGPARRATFTAASMLRAA